MSESLTFADTSENSSVDTVAVDQTRSDRPWLFRPGHDPRRNVLGRIKKAPTVWDETQKLAQKTKTRRRIAQAWVDTMAAPHTPAGNRARADYMAYDVGLPKQAFVVETQDSPMLSLMQRLAARGALPTVVEGESRLLPPADDTQDVDAQT